MSRIDRLNDLEAVVKERKSEAVKAHWEWLDARDAFGTGAKATLEALAKKDALSDMLKEAYEELEALQEEIKHG